MKKYDVYLFHGFGLAFIYATNDLNEAHEKMKEAEANPEYEFAEGTCLYDNVARKWIERHERDI